MRILRLVSGLVALALVATLSGTTLATSAQAAKPAALERVGAADHATKAAAAKPRHQVKNLRNKRVGRQAFRILGKTPTYANKRVIVRSDNCNGRNCKFKGVYTRDKTSRTGAFKFVVRGIGKCFQLVVPGTKRYKVRKVLVGCITRS